ncbi:MAG: hypothetical protein C0423_19090 [Methylibium sp.]|nr:hypothetical protein [Methylibium sp.]
MFKKTLLTMATVAACLGAASVAQAAPVALFNADYRSAGGGSRDSLVFGNRFTMSSSITAIALGLFDRNSDGFVEAHQVGLWNASNGSLLASVSFGPGQAGTLGPGVNAVGLPNSGMRYLDIAGVLLEAGQSYWLAALFPAPLYDFVGDASNVSSSYASGFSGAYSFSNTLIQPGTAYGNALGVNLLLDDGSSNGAGGNSVPEPATLIQVLTLLGALALVRRRRA